MEEKLIERTNNKYQSDKKKMYSIFYILTVVCVAIFFITLVASEGGKGSTAAGIITIVGVLGAISLFMGIRYNVTFMRCKETEIYVTDKRIYGTIQGKNVDLPLNTVRSVGTTNLMGIIVYTDSAHFSFNGIDDRDEVYSKINELLMKKQDAPQTVTVSKELSSADEIKKFKDLLDQGIISEEEFENKKKQLLGL